MVETITTQPEDAAEAAAFPTFAQAVDAHKAMVYSIGWHILGDRAVAEELAQDVFLELHRRWRSIKSAGLMRHWLRRVTTHRAIDCARKRRLRLETSLDEATREPGVLERMHDSLLSSYLERMVATLPEKQRAVIVLRYQEEMELEEMAELLGEKVSTVKTQIFRALELLRAKTARCLGTRVE